MRIRRQGRSRPLRKRSARLAMRTEARGWMTDYIPFDWQDPFRLDDQIAPEEGAIRDLARDYFQTELQPRIRSAFRNEEFDRSIMTEMGSLRSEEHTSELQSLMRRSYAVFCSKKTH